MSTRHITLAANQVTTVTSDKDCNAVGVFHTGNTNNDVWMTLNGQDPTPNGDDTYVVPAGSRREINRYALAGTSTGASINAARKFRGGGGGPAEVRLMSAGAVAVEVEFV